MLRKSQERALIRFLMENSEVGGEYYMNYEIDKIDEMGKYDDVKLTKLKALRGIGAREAIEKLVILGYVEDFTLNDELPYVCLSRNGRMYFETKRDERLAFLKNSILVPVIVAVISTILTSRILPIIFP